MNMITRVILINLRSENEVATILMELGYQAYIKLFLLFPGINLLLLLCSNTNNWFKQKASQNRVFVRTPRTPPGYGPEIIPYLVLPVILGLNFCW